MTVIRIPRRLRGPPTSGNGGCACGLVARALGASVEVTLHAPPPLEVELTVDGNELRHGARRIATAAPFEERLDALPPLDPEIARRASSSFRHGHDHPLSTCFVCGTAREDGLKIWPGAVPDGEGVAAPWTPDRSLADERGDVPLEVVWGSLDCPQYFGLGADAPFMLLGRMAAVVHRGPRIGEACVVRGWRVGGSGRKGIGAAALYAGDELLAVARGTWIEVDPARFA